MSWDDVQATLERELGEAITLDSLTVQWRIAQRAAGHRHSVDDVLTAHHATIVDGNATSVLDLGSGIGGVGLLALWALGASARLVCVEAQKISHRLLVANVMANGLADRVTVRHGDLRDLTFAQRFPLITGSPPYFPIGTGVLPADDQKAHARFELRGHVGDYARAAERHLTDDGAFVFCFPTAQRTRALQLVDGSGLHVVAMRDVIPRVGLRPLFTLFTCRRAAREPIIEPAFEVRTADGEVSAAMQAVRARFGFAT